ncbi:transcriptional regulator [Enemella evansiae]|uniref:lactate racemase domain-containing protein n=1 Tax=Enemella evansiae TaxID=2016499 RepID=UPI000B965B90|nr:lactate racemase domain-containing protein [Enemella evansiae]OYO07331.1 transcriptional regulator [Enemella evansiae]OYO12348.1 transcriptional regulator [Enemella evansiae]
MSRPGFVLEVDDRTPPLLIGEGAGCRLERLPVGTRVAYPAESLPGVPHVGEAIDQALSAPLGAASEPAAPLATRLKPGMKLAITFTDGSRPAPSAAAPDLRGRVLEQVLELAAAAGVDDVRLVAANGLRRKQTSDELRGLVGERVHRSFAVQQRLTAHDAEAPDLVEVAPGVLLNKTVAEADLVVNVVLVDSPQRTGWDQLATGLTGTATAWAQTGLGGDPAVRAEVAGVLADELEVFQIEVVLDQQLFPPQLGFLSRREWDWKVRDRVAFLGFRQFQAIAPHRVRRMYFDTNPAPYGVLQVAAGDVTAVGAASAELVTRQQGVRLGEPADVLLAGPAPVTEHNIGAVMNPLIAAWDTLGRAFNAYTGKPAVREGGAMILFHPLTQAFNSRFHTASADFFADVLPATTDTGRIRSEFEPKFLGDEWYANLYRTQNAFHGVHPLQLWYATRAAVEHCGDIIWVGADRSSAERMGFRAASTLADALEIASATVGRNPAITHLHTPPSMLAELS